MAKKKRSRQKELPKEFSNSPFKNLKGLSVLEPEAVKPQGSSQQNSAHEASPLNGGDEEFSFADEMAFLGVKQVNGSDLNRDDLPVGAEKSGMPPVIKSAEDEFLDAVSSLDKVFKDEWPEDGHLARAVPRRMKQLEKRQFKPGDQLDLHGLTVTEASEKVKFFLHNSVYRNHEAVLIITGKGLHSEEGPVLRTAVDRLLRDLSELVIEWGIAPRRYGGDGALVVFLRQKIWNR